MIPCGPSAAELHTAPRGGSHFSAARTASTQAHEHTWLHRTASTGPHDRITPRGSALRHRCVSTTLHTGRTGRMLRPFLSPQRWQCRSVYSASHCGPFPLLITLTQPTDNRRFYSSSFDSAVPRFRRPWTSPVTDVFYDPDRWDAGDTTHKALEWQAFGRWSMTRAATGPWAGREAAWQCVIADRRRVGRRPAVDEPTRTVGTAGTYCIDRLLARP